MSETTEPTRRAPAVSVSTTITENARPVLDAARHANARTPSVVKSPDERYSAVGRPYAFPSSPLMNMKNFS